MNDHPIRLALIAAALVLTGALIAHLFPSPRAEAQRGPRQWRECFAASLWRHDGAAMANPGFQPRTVHVPQGWIPIGGSGQPGRDFVVLCR